MFTSAIKWICLLAIIGAYCVGVSEFAIHRIGTTQYLLIAVSVVYMLRFVPSIEGVCLLKRIRWPVYVLAIALFALGSQRDSPYINAVSAGLMGVFLLLAIRPGLILTDLIRLGGIVLCVYPFPVFIINTISVWLQGQSTYVCSALCDALGVIHYNDGVVFYLQSGPPLEIESACSGIVGMGMMYSFYAVLTLIRRTSLTVALLTAIIMLPLLLLGNALRITTVIVAEAWYQVDLVHGPVHTMLGLGLLVITLITVLSFESWLRLQFEHHISLDEFWWWNVFYDYPDDEPRLHLTWLLPTAICCTVFAIEYSTHSQVTRSPIVPPAGTMVQADFLPAEYYGYKLVKATPRGTSASDKAKSLVWEFKHPLNGEVLLVAVDYPFTGPHAVEQCYINSGFEMQLGTINHGRYREVPLLKDGQLYRLSYFQMKQDGTLLPAGTLGSYLDRFVYGTKAPEGPQLLNYQVQMRTTNVVPSALHAQIMEDLERRTSAFIEQNQ